MARIGISLAKGASRTQEDISTSADEIARVAYELFARRGCGHGSDQEDWFEAERIVRERRQRRNRR